MIFFVIFNGFFGCFWYLQFLFVLCYPAFKDGVTKGAIIVNTLSSIFTPLQLIFIRKANLILCYKDNPKNITNKAMTSSQAPLVVTVIVIIVVVIIGFVLIRGKKK